MRVMQYHAAVVKDRLRYEDFGYKIEEREKKSDIEIFPQLKTMISQCFKYLKIKFPSSPSVRLSVGLLVARQVGRMVSLS